MKRIIPFLLLAGVAVACQDDGPTVPAVDPQFAKPDCVVDDTHPSCKGDGGGDTGAYTATPLGKPKVVTKARDLSDPLGDDPLVISGVSEQANGDPVATVWTVTADAVTPTQLEPRAGRPVSTAPGINDDGDIVVGFDGSGMGGAGNIHIMEPEPLMWTGPNWEATPLDLDGDYGHYDHGYARDVNNSGMIVGTSWIFIGYVATATVWNDEGQVVAMYPSWDPAGDSEGKAINNEGYVVGFGTTENANYPPWHAQLWRPDGTYCDLHEISGWGEDRKSTAVGISDVMGDGTVLVVGTAVWQVNPETCALVWSWESPDAGFHGVSLNWEAAGSTKSGKWLPALYDLQTSSVTVLDNAGGALEVNRAGQIVGWVPFKGTDRAMLWTPNPTP
jgi:uncharacterized membrane protein